MIYRVKSAPEALLLMERLQSSGEYDLFRGQNENWKLSSSFARLNEQERQAATERLAFFSEWANTTLGMEHFAENDDSLLAVAQHYGIATPFVDFTTNPSVAIQFALHGKVTNNDAGIVLINTSEFDAFKRKLSDRIPDIERVKILRPTAPNLWRLEAQFGVFLDLPTDNFERIYDFDRILFPNAGGDELTGLPLIYPERKSALERLLDQYFMEEKLRKGSEFVEKQFSSLMVAMEVIEPEIRNGVHESYFSSDIAIHSSWSGENTLDWHHHQIPPEEFQDHLLGPFRIVLDTDQTGQVRFEKLISVLLHALNSQKIRRGLTEKFQIVLPPDWLSRSSSSGLSIGTQRIWDGMRSLPYTNMDISHAITRYLQISSLNGDMKEVYKAPVMVEFSSKPRGSYSRAIISTAWNSGLVRSDINEYIKPVFRKELSKNLIGLLRTIRSPAKLFDFPHFAHWFADQIIPSQEFERGPSGLAQYYSPVEIKVMGLA